MRPHYFFPLILFLASQAPHAQTVIYTTSHNPVKDVEPGVLVFVLDEAQQLEQSLFPALSGNPEQAERQVQQIMTEPNWREKEARLTAAYQALSNAWSLGIAKTPAVVLDNQYVVYGTTDTILAQQKLDHWREQQP